MAQIAVILDDYFEDSEYSKPVEAFQNAGHQTITVGLEKGKNVHGKSEGTKVHIARSFDDADEVEFDALFIPGGYSPDRLRANPQAVKFVRRFMDKDKPVFSICHGAQILITAQSLEGRKVTGWKSIAQDIRYAGAEYLDKDVVEDGNLISSRQPGDIPAFNEACLEKLNVISHV